MRKEGHECDGVAGDGVTQVGITRSNRAGAEGSVAAVKRRGRRRLQRGNDGNADGLPRGFWDLPLRCLTLRGYITPLKGGI